MTARFDARTASRNALTLRARLPNDVAVLTASPPLSSLQPRGGGTGPASAPRRPALYWPTPSQELLLHAALSDDETARASWQRWLAGADLDRIDAGTERLLPLAMHHVQRAGGDPHVARYDGVVAYTWASNQRRLAQLTPIAEALHRAGVPVMLLKGMALARHHYAHLGLRPMDDVDLLVPTSDAFGAMEVLHAAGARSDGNAVDLATTHSRPFLLPQGAIDLHWHVLWELCGAGIEDALWDRAGTATLGRAAIRVLSPADLLLQAVVHGARWNPVNPIRWVADAATVIASSGPTFDWALLCGEAIRHGLALPVRQALGYLADTFRVPVPAVVLAELAAHRATVFERVEQRMREVTSPRLGCFPLVVCHHVRLSRRAGAGAVIWRLPRYLQAAYGVPRVRDVPAVLWGRAARRVGSQHEGGHGRAPG